jgi:orotate phosphoribosyltransferase-like protein
MAQKGSQVRNVVLVHGAWADGSSWSDVIEKLQDKGYKVTALIEKAATAMIEKAPVATSK